MVWVERSYIIDGGVSPLKGSRATDLTVPKKVRGQMFDGAVRLSEPDWQLGIAESFEDALAVQELYRMPCWAAIGAGRIAKLWLPQRVKEVIIFADADEAGRRAVEEACATYGKRCRVGTALPTPPHKDFCEML
jgi:hypothetical protein